MVRQTPSLAIREDPMLRSSPRRLLTLVTAAAVLASISAARSIADDDDVIASRASHISARGSGFMKPQLTRTERRPRGRARRAMSVWG